MGQRAAGVCGLWRSDTCVSVTLARCRVTVQWATICLTSCHPLAEPTSSSSVYHTHASTHPPTQLSSHTSTYHTRSVHPLTHSLTHRSPTHRLAHMNSLTCSSVPLCTYSLIPLRALTQALTCPQSHVPTPTPTPTQTLAHVLAHPLRP
jgi:hypothetical protein